MEYFGCYNRRRLHGGLGPIPPVEHETNHHNKITTRSGLMAVASLTTKPLPTGA